MSRKVSVQSSEMKDSAAVLSMLTRMGLKGSVQGNKVNVTGKGLVTYQPTYINLTTGQLDGDEDNNSVYAAMKQQYAVAAGQLAYVQEGFLVEQETVLPDGSIAVDYVRNLPVTYP